VTPRAITGFGVVASLGIGRSAWTAALRDGTIPAPAPPTAAFDARAYPEARVAEVPDFEPSRFLGEKGLRSLDRQTKLLVVAARLCLHDAGLKKDGRFVALSPERVGFCAGNAYGSLEAISELDRVAVLEDARYINPAKFPNTVANSASGYVSIWEDLRALNVAISDGSCGALDSLACADIYLSCGRADAILVGGGEALSEPLYVAWKRAGRLAGGTPLGEGAALFVLETEESAKARGARVAARLLGLGTSFHGPAHDGVLLHAAPEAMERAVDDAVTDAGLLAGDIDLVVSGASRSGAYAAAELGGIARALGESVPIAAPKSLFGETLGASGALGMAAALTWMEGIAPRAIVRGEAPTNVKTVVVTTLGLYGNATAAVLRRG